MAKSDHIYHGDPRHHHTEISKLKQHIEELEEEIRKRDEEGLTRKEWNARGW